METKQLSQREARFVEEYIKDLNGKQAAIRAGYSANSAKEIAYELLTRPHVQDAVADGKEALRKRVLVDQEFVVNGIIGLIEKCEAAVPVKDREGNETGEYTVQAAPAMKGYELLSRHLGMLNDKLEVKGNIDIADRLVTARRRNGLK